MVLLLKEMIRNRIVVSVSDDKLKKYLIDVEDLNLSTCTQKAKQYVSHHAQARLCTVVGEENLDAVRQATQTNYARLNKEVKHDKSNMKRCNGQRKVAKCGYCNRPNHH